MIIGRGLTIGRPLALLMALSTRVQRGGDRRAHRAWTTWRRSCACADVIVAAAGRAGIVTRDMVKPGAAVVGAGTTFEGEKLLSDVSDDVGEVAGWVTPRLGGVGPMTRAMLLRNAVLAAEKVS